MAPRRNRSPTCKHSTRQAQNDVLNLHPPFPTKPQPPCIRPNVERWAAQAFSWKKAIEWSEAAQIRERVCEARWEGRVSRANRASRSGGRTWARRRGGSLRLRRSVRGRAVTGTRPGCRTVAGAGGGVFPTRPSRSVSASIRLGRPPAGAGVVGAAPGTGTCETNGWCGCCGSVDIGMPSVAVAHRHAHPGLLHVHRRGATARPCRQMGCRRRAAACPCPAEAAACPCPAGPSACPCPAAAACPCPAGPLAWAGPSAGASSALAASPPAANGSAAAAGGAERRAATTERVGGSGRGRAIAGTGAGAAGAAPNGSAAAGMGAGRGRRRAEGVSRGRRGRGRERIGARRGRRRGDRSPPPTRQAWWRTDRRPMAQARARTQARRRLWHQSR